jgi:hypothetical protein
LVGEPALLSDVLLEVPVLAELGHDVDVILGHEDFDCFENVGVRKGSEGIDLVVQQILLHFALNLAEFENFDCDGFTIEFVEALVDVRAEATANDLGWIVDVVFDLLYQLVLILTTPSLALIRHSKIIISCQMTSELKRLGHILS